MLRLGYGALVVGVLAVSGCGESITPDAGGDTDAGGGCTSDAECGGGVCLPDGTCGDPSCTDRVRNGSETDVDCGGSCPSCADGDTCSIDSDCVSGRCAASVCAPPLLAVGATCTSPDQCASGTCRAFGASSVCSEACTTTCSVGGLACFEGFCTPSTFCENPDGFGDGPGCTGSDCDRCAATATCVEQPSGAYSCICNTGYTGNGLTCGDVDECTLGTDDCHADATCTNTVGSFDCACDDGFSGDGTSCTDDDECTLGTDDCHDLATCMNTAGSFTCTCPDLAPGDGRTCTHFTSCRALLAALPGSPSGMYTIDTGTGGPVAVYCDMTTDGAGGYTMVRFDDDGALFDNQATYRDFCAARGMEVIVPRTRAHAAAIRAFNGGALPNLVNVFPKTDGATGLANWEGRCQGAPCTFWLSDSNNAGCLGFEPNGDNNTNDALYLADASTCDYGHWNDGHSTMGFVGYVICSTNDAGPAPATSCRDALDADLVHNASASGISGTYTIDTGTGGPIDVFCDLASDGGAGYTMVRFDDASLTDNQTAYRDFCAARGMEVVVPRTRAHAAAIRAYNGGTPPNLVNVFPETDGATGLAAWEGRCQGAPCNFWLSNSNNGGCLGFEPNGDNNTQNALALLDASVCDYGHWNDAFGGMGITGYVICSTNDDAGPPMYSSCREMLVAGSVHNVSDAGITGAYEIDTGTGTPISVRCDMATDSGVGYTMARLEPTSLVGNGNQADYRAACAAAGMEVIVPRTPAHAASIRTWNGNSPPNLVNVFPRFDGAVGLSNWEGRCRGASCTFWLSNSNNAGCLGFEPNGDNNTNDALYLIDAASCDYGHWNDGNNAMSITGHVICSTNDTP
jgi:hypothetical protein